MGWRFGGFRMDRNFRCEGMMAERDGWDREREICVWKSYYWQREECWLVRQKLARRGRYWDSSCCLGFWDLEVALIFDGGDGVASSFGWPSTTDIWRRRRRNSHGSLRGVRDLPSSPLLLMMMMISNVSCEREKDLVGDGPLACLSLFLFLSIPCWKGRVEKGGWWCRRVRAQQQIKRGILFVTPSLATYMHIRISMYVRMCPIISAWELLLMFGFWGRPFDCLVILHVGLTKRLGRKSFPWL